jgi:dTDP-glucose 4,6-dehydratase
MRILMSGGAGFIGSEVIRHVIARPDHKVLNLDRLKSAIASRGIA